MNLVKVITREVPKGYNQALTKFLAGEGVKVLFENGQTAYVTFQDKMFSITDNGGEFNVRMVNNAGVDQPTTGSIPFENMPLSIVDPNTVGYRLVKQLRGEFASIDWNWNYPTL